VVVGPELSDDAAVVRLPSEPGSTATDERNLILTTDTIGPIVDDAETFGAIAAANAMSDVWAMGGRPRWALNLAFFPEHRLPLEILRRIMIGARDKCAEAGVAIVGGHTVRNEDLKFGLSVTGELTRGQKRPLANTRAMPGQWLVLTKAIGTGVIGTAIKRQTATPQQIAAATRSMLALNAHAAELARVHGATACTDVTGFGLLGHLRNLLRGSRLRASVELGRIPLLPGALELVDDYFCGGSQSNLDYLERSLVRRYTATDTRALALTKLACDAQTSGGLLIAARGEGAERLLEELRASGHQAAIIGELLAAKPAEVGKIELVI
jgi:selenide,water dikinase